jgi:hypothetical protein
MDYKDCKVKRHKKSDKAKESYEKNGGFTQKHIRLSMAAAEARLNTKK